MKYYKHIVCARCDGRTVYLKELRQTSEKTKTCIYACRNCGIININELKPIK